MVLGVGAGAWAQAGFPPEVRFPPGKTEADVAEKRPVEPPPRLRGHRESYVLGITYAEDPNGRVQGFREVKHREVKFQVSVRYRLFDVKRLGGKVVAGYTNTSFWQLYNWSESAPFRTTDHEPEVFYEQKMNDRYDDRHPRYWRVGVVHESNGEGLGLSRSWNRVFGEILVGQVKEPCCDREQRRFPRPGSYGSVKFWWNFDYDDSERGNPRIDKYMGNVELRGEHVWPCWARPRLLVMVRNNLRSDGNRGAVQVDFSIAPWGMGPRLRLQYFNGYGESLIDYDHNSNRIGLGFELTY